MRIKIVELGAIKTEFMRNFQFTNDESITKYQKLLKRTNEMMGPMMEQGAEPEVVAESIYRTARAGAIH